MKFKQRFQILVRLSFQELYDSRLSGLHPFNKKWPKSETSETLILEVIFVTLTENSSVRTIDTQGLQKYPHHQKQL